MQIFTPYKSTTREVRLCLDLSESDRRKFDAIDRNDNNTVITVTDMKSKKKYKVSRWSCGSPHCNCAAAVRGKVVVAQPEIRVNPKPQQMWGVYNWGSLVNVCFLRQQAIEYARESLPDEGKNGWKKYYEIHKVEVKKVK